MQRSGLYEAGELQAVDVGNDEVETTSEKSF
jgi:hypothetical protein